MSIERVKKLLKEKENIHLEFKEAKNALPANLFESICAMLNRDGGDILLGVNNDGVVIGIDEVAVSTMVTNIVNLSNNPQKLDPPFILFPQVHGVNSKKLIYIQVPASSMIHKAANIIFDRSNDGDFKITQPHQIAESYNRKRTHYTENIVYPYLKFTDFKKNLFPKVRNLISSNSANHPWLSLDNKQLLEMAGLWKRDFQLGTEGYTLAAGLLFGKDEIVQQIIPHYKIDALVRIENTDRYDDRFYIQTNLIEAYEQLMDFVAKHLPDKFHLVGDQRISLRSKIFREVVANLIIHREYTNAHPCTFVIYRDRVEAQNANNPHGEGPINPHNFAPFPKNPAIAKFFVQLGRVDELGSGILNVSKYIKAYSGMSKPQFIEGAVFKATIPIPEIGIGGATEEISVEVDGLNEGVIEGVVNGGSKKVKDRLLVIANYVLNNPGAKVADLATGSNISERILRENIKTLMESGFITYKGSRKTGGYHPTLKLKRHRQK